MIRLKLNWEVFQASFFLMMNEAIDATLEYLNQTDPDRIVNIKKNLKKFFKAILKLPERKNCLRGFWIISMSVFSWTSAGRPRK